MRIALLVILLGTARCTEAGQPGPVDGQGPAEVDSGSGIGPTADLGPDLYPDGPIECFGTIYPGIGPINPDAPVYSDTEWTQEEVTEAFLEAKAGDTMAYRAYKAAFELGDILECAFCSCGCASIASHMSDLDCFKDMHGYG